jgi:peptidyl-prolyl cis-trans isomerase C
MTPTTTPSLLLAAPLFLLTPAQAPPAAAAPAPPAETSQAPPAATAQAPPPGGPAAAEPVVLAVVNGEPVHAEDLKRLLEQMHSGAAQGARTRPDLDRLMFRLVNDVLLAQEARALGMDEEDPVPAKLAARRESLAVLRLEREEVASKATATEEEIREAFETEYRRVTFRILTVREREEAAALRDRIEKGADFAALAREKSVDPYGPREGLVKDLARIDTPHEFAAAVFALEPGALAGPLVTRIGYSVLRVESLAPADAARLDERKASLRTLVQLRKAEARRADLAARLRAAHRVVVDEAALLAIVPERLPDGRLMPKVEIRDAVVARVGERTVTAGRLGQALGLRWGGVANEEAAVAAKPIVLDRLVQQELMAAEALARGYGDTDEVRRALHADKTQLLVSRYLSQVVAAEVRVTPEEMSAWYEQHKESYHRPPRLRLRQVTVATEAEAQRLADLARKGTDVGWLARQHSTDGYKDAGGDRGWVTPKQTGEAFEEALLTAKPGDVLGPTPAPEGFNVARVEAREEQGVYEYKEVSGNVRRAVEEEKLQQAVHAVVQKLRSRSKIEVHEDRLAALQISATPAAGPAPAHSSKPRP